jgi:hypothetical protein
MLSPALERSRRDVESSRQALGRRTMALDFKPSHLVGLRRVSALMPCPDGAASVVVVERLDAEEAKYVRRNS